MTTVLVTGCNRGIGLQLAQQFTARGDDVIAVCRTASEALQNSGVRMVAGVDVADGDDVARLSGELSGEKIDVLVNNAGILRSDSLDSVDYDAMLEQFRVNSLGPLRVVRALLDNLDPGSKVAIVSSRVGSIEDNGSGNNYGYRVSKVAANMIGVNLAHDLRPRGIAVTLLHPGLVATEMTGGSGVSTELAASGLIKRIDELNMETSGGFWHAEGYRLPW